MRPLTRNVLVVIGVVVVGLLALGAVPGYLGSGTPHYLTVEPVDGSQPAINVSEVSERRFPFLIAALKASDGRSEPYQTGSYGIKEQFTHTPFNEVDALGQRQPNAIQGDGVRITFDGQRYYVEIVEGAS